jgi:hypothetical protein
MGVPRSGTSCVAGVLHQLGVDMGAGHFQPKDWANPRGYFEDMRWRLVTQRITGRGYSLRAASLESIGHGQRKLYRQLARQCAQRRLWGMKDPWLCFVARFIWPILEQQGVEVRLVVTSRAREASIASVKGHLYKTYRGQGDAERIIDTWQAGLDRQIKEWAGRGPAIVMPYDDLIRAPREKTKYLADFAYQGIGRVNGSIETAARWVTPQLNHHRGAV